MVYDQKLAERMRKLVPRGTKDKEMFGGLAFMLKGKMFVGIVKNDLMVRAGKERHEKLLKKKGARTMNFTGKPMKGFIFVSPEGIKTKKQLSDWIKLAADFVSTIKK